jgi:hypothetical protein
MPLSDGDFIDGDLPQPLEFRFAKAARKVAFLNVFDDIPTYSQVLRNALDRHVPTQIQSVALELAGVASLGISEFDCDLPQRIAHQAKHALDGQNDTNRLGTDRDTGKRPLNSAFTDNLEGAASWTEKVCFPLTNLKDHFTVMVLGADILIATDTESVIQEAGGHEGFLPSLEFWRTTMKKA